MQNPDDAHAVAPYGVVAGQVVDRARPCRAAARSIGSLSS